MIYLELFSGGSVARQSVKELGLPVTRWYSSEINKFPIQIANDNHDDLIHLGDVRGVLDKIVSHKDIDVIFCGSPCQGFSFSGKQLNFADPRSALYFEFVRLLKESKPKYFLLENVRMKKEYQEVITKDLGVEPIMINSSLLSAQNRVRLYWTNIPNITQPKDLGILLKDVLQYEAENEYAEPYVKLNGKEKGCVGYVGNKPAQATRIYSTNEKSQSLMANGGGQGGKTGLYQIPVQGGAFRGRYQEDGSIKQELEIRPDDKTNTLTTVQKDNVVVRKKSKAIRVGGRGSYDRHEWDSVGNKNSELFYRKLTCVECERLMTVPDNYTEGVSNTQRYKMLGNGWSVDVIKHIFSNAIWT